MYYFLYWNGSNKSVVPFMAIRLIFGLSQGAFLSAPYILARELNEPKNIPKAMGALATSVAVGSLTGSIVAGVLKDLGYLSLGIIAPTIPFIIGVVFIYFGLPNKKQEGKVYIDIVGFILLAIALIGILLSVSFGNKIGWGNTKIIIDFIIGITALIAFIKVENKSPDPIISMQLFKNKNYVSLLLIGFICYSYTGAMSSYAPLAVQKVMGNSGAVSGSLQVPRTIITILLSVASDIWVSKRKANFWIAMAIGTVFVSIPFAVLSNTHEQTLAIIYYIMLGITGIAESFCGVAITPAAQATLEPKDLRVGTALVNFTNISSILINSAIFGIAYDLPTKNSPNSIESIKSGENSVFMITSIICAIVFLIVIFVIGKQINNSSRE